MSSPNLTHRHVIGPVRKATPPPSAIPKKSLDSAAVADTTLTGRHSKESPLWNLAIALMALCGAAVIVIAFS